MNRYAVVLFVLGLVAYFGGEAAGYQLYASCDLTPDPAYTGDQITGSVLFRQTVSPIWGPSYMTAVYVRLSGFSTDGEHGIHIHDKGDMSGGCKSCGGHYNPEGKNHGAPGDNERHVGDLGNVEVKDGEVNVYFVDRLLTLSGSGTIVGRSVVFHEGVDDLGLGGFSDSLSTGHAGARMGCCIIVESDGTEWQDALGWARK